MKNSLNYFLGCSTEQGFYGYFEQVANPKVGRVYLVKGGPGSGKSSLMRRMGIKLETLGHSIGYIHCVSDPQSLDGIFCPDLGITMLDATSPHAVDPALPMARQKIVSLYECMDEDFLDKNLPDLTDALVRHKALAARPRRYFAAANRLYEQAQYASCELLNHQKLKKYTAGLVKRTLMPTGNTASEQNVLFCGFTPDGFVDYRAANFASAKTAVILNDRAGAVAAEMLQQIRTIVLSQGHSVFAGHDPLCPTKLNCVYVADCDTVFAASSYLLPLKIDGAKVINCSRFCEKGSLSVTATLSLCKKTLLTACSLMSDARAAHDVLERFYTPAMDFDAVRELEGSFMRKILSRNTV